MVISGKACEIPFWGPDKAADIEQNTEEEKRLIEEVTKRSTTGFHLARFVVP